MCRLNFVKRLLMILLFLLLFSPAAGSGQEQPHDRLMQGKETSVIMEVEGDANVHKRYLQTYFPQTEVIAVYDTLFDGLAIKAKPDKLAKIASLHFVKAIHPVHTYQTNTLHRPLRIGGSLERRSMSDDLKEIQKTDRNAVFPHEINTTNYTGEGVKVGVIDTGIDYDHPDIQKNYQGGYDLVDLDDDPMETTSDQGEPTLHGTHVAGTIAANGHLKGVAPDASIYAYRALGPGGAGTSAQVIAALEQAVKDGMDIVNLSLGNSVNGPDYPTSIAVNKASELGVLVVTANGNSGPDNWTVGSPATAVKSFSVGASSNAQQIPVLVTKQSDAHMQMIPMQGSLPWNLQRDYAVTTDITQSNGKIALIKRGKKIPFYELAKQAQNNGAVAVLIYNNEPGAFQGSVASKDGQLQIPVASLSKQDGEALADYSRKHFPYVDTVIKQTEAGMAAFSSRGPVTVNWQIKPNISAPGTNIVSTVPGGYQALQGTSMAAPHVSGAAALLKEAHPDWPNEKIIAALETTAKRINDSNGQVPPATVQGMGEIQPDAAINADTIIYGSSLVFGKTGKKSIRDTAKITIENTSDQEKTYHFDIPKVEKGIGWQLPKTIFVAPKQKKKVKIQINLLPMLLKKGMHQGWLSMSDGEKIYHLPYLFINQDADSPKAGGIEFSLKPFSENEYIYRFYLSEAARSVQATLYDPDTLVYKRKLLELDDAEQGMNEGKLDKKQLPESGRYVLLFTIQTEDGDYETQEIPVEIGD